MLDAAKPGARAIGSVVERLVHTEEVTGSNPVSPTQTSAVQSPLGVQQGIAEDSTPPARLPFCVSETGHASALCPFQQTQNAGEEVPIIAPSPAVAGRLGPDGGHHEDQDDRHGGGHQHQSVVVAAEPVLAAAYGAVERGGGVPEQALAGRRSCPFLIRLTGSLRLSGGVGGGDGLTPDRD